MNTVDQSNQNVRKAIEFIRQYPQYFALIPALLVGMSRYRAAVEPVLIIAAAGFLSRIGRPNGVSKLAAASIVIAWAALGFLRLPAGRELLVIAGAIWG